MKLLNYVKKLTSTNILALLTFQVKLLRDAFLAISEKMVDLFNLSFELSEIPEAWRVAKITILPKAGNSKVVSNSRPISLLPLASKIVHNRIYTFCNDNNLLDKKQWFSAESFNYQYNYQYN